MADMEPSVRESIARESSLIGSVGTFSSFSGLAGRQRTRS